MRHATRFGAPRRGASWRFAVPVALVLLLVVPALARAADVSLHGLLDVTASGRGRGFESNALFRGDSNFDPYRLLLSAEGSLAPEIEFVTHLRLGDGAPLYVDGAWVRWTPDPARDLHLEAGKIPWIIGTWAPRTYSDHNPLIGAPLLYQLHTTLLWWDVPPDADALLAASGRGQYGVGYSGFGSSRGMAVVDDSWWDVGADVTGSLRPLEYAFGATLGTPGWGNPAHEENGGKTVLGRIGVLPLPGLRLGVSGARGSYLHEYMDPYLPDGQTASDFHQNLGMADLEVLFGHVELRSEAFLNVWETPTVGDLRVRGGYGEAKVTVLPGVYLAGRWDRMLFSDVIDSGGAAHPWDLPRTRWEAGAGWRPRRDLIFKLVGQRTITHFAAADANDDLLAAQLGIKF